MYRRHSVLFTLGTEHSHRCTCHEYNNILSIAIAPYASDLIVKALHSPPHHRMTFQCNRSIRHTSQFYTVQPGQSPPKRKAGIMEQNCPVRILLNVVGKIIMSHS